MIKKVIFSFIINFILLIILGFVSIKQINTLSSLTNGLYEHPLAILDATRTIQTHLISMHRYMKDAESAKNINDIKNAKQHVDASRKIILEQFTILFKKYLGNKENIQTSYELFIQSKSIQNEVIDLIYNHKHQEAFAITKAKGVNNLTKLDVEINKLLSCAENKADAYHKNILKSEIEAKEFIISFLVIISLFSLLTFILLLQNLLKKDKKIHNYIKTIELNYKFEQYANNISKHLVYGKDIDICLNNTLKELGMILNAHRSYLFLFNNDYSFMDNTHEWCSHGTRPEIDNLQNISTEALSWWVQQCKDLKPMAIEDINALPKEAQNEKESFLEQNIKSLLVYPVIINKESVGFIRIDMVHNYQKWTDTHHSFVKLTAESIANALEKKNYIEEISNSHYKMSLTLNTASNGILAITEDNKISFYNQKLLQIWELDSLDEDIDTLEKLFYLTSVQFRNYDICLSKLHHFNENKKQEQLYLFHLKNQKVIEIISAPSFDNGKFKGNSISFKDVSEKISFEKELELSAKVFENSLEGIVITDAETNILKVNDSFSKITGYSREELIGQKPAVLHSNWHDKKFYDSMWKSLAKNSIWEGEIKDRRKSGELYVNSATLIMIKNSDDNVTNYIGINRDITDMKKTQDHIKSLAYHDSLTNLPNRTLFYDRLAQNIKYCKRNEVKMALLFIDLDNFKIVNDTHGHHTGDLLLQKVATLLEENIRTSDTVSRLGGDEFTIILSNINSKDDVIVLANKITTQLQEPILVNNIPLDIGSSIGAAIYPDDAQDKDTLIEMADRAMYNAKNSGKNFLKFFESE